MPIPVRKPPAGFSMNNDGTKGQGPKRRALFEGDSRRMLHSASTSEGALGQFPNTLSVSNVNAIIESWAVECVRVDIGGRAGLTEDIGGGECKLSRSAHVRAVPRKYLTPATLCQITATFVAVFIGTSIRKAESVLVRLVP